MIDVAGSVAERRHVCASQNVQNPPERLTGHAEQEVPPGYTQQLKQGLPGGVQVLQNFAGHDQFKAALEVRHVVDRGGKEGNRRSKPLSLLQNGMGNVRSPHPGVGLTSLEVLSEVPLATANIEDGSHREVRHEARNGSEKVLDELPGDGVVSAVFIVNIASRSALRRQGCWIHRPHVETLPARSVNIPLDFRDQWTDRLKSRQISPFGTISIADGEMHVGRIANLSF